MTVRVVGYARLREILRDDALACDVAAGATVDDLVEDLVRRFPALRDVRASTRFVRDGALVSGDALLRDGDEVALLPPFGGG